MKTKHLILLILILITSPLYSQIDGEDIIIGKYRVIQSDILNEERRILVHLPLGYEATELKYPVVFHLYGDFLTTYYTPALTATDRLHDSGLMPQVILIGVDNTDRYRDLRPLDREGNPGGSGSFASYFKEELIPFLKNNYRIEDYFVLVGPQAGACFGLYSLMEHPGLFDAFILENSFLNPPNVIEYLEEKANSFFNRDRTLNKFLYLSVQKEASNYQHAIIQKQIIESAPPMGFRFVFREINEDIYSPPGVPIQEGLLELFMGYACGDDIEVEDLDDILEYYESLSKELGFSLNISDRILREYAQELMREGKKEEAKEIWEYVLKLYPKSLDGLFNMAQICFSEGNYQDAKRYYEAFLEIRPNEVFVQNSLKRVLEMIDKSKEE
jgi:predicted alpha/beta superfamily hydrolase